MIRRRTWRHAALIMAIACAILVLGCGLGIASMQRGMVAPPEVNMRVGSIRLVGLSSRLPECSRLLVPGCESLTRASTARIYTLWLLVQREPNSWDRPKITSLLTMQIGR